jgi:hypothetical protein
VTESLKCSGLSFKIAAHQLFSTIWQEIEMVWKNEGTVDRVLRVIVGLAVLSLVFVGPETAWGWLGLVPLVTGLVGTCPLYSILGVNTCGIPRGSA